jgi:hypothetical protein
VPAFEKKIVRQSNNKTMENSGLDRKVSNILHEFEKLGDIQPSDDWNQSLMSRLSSTRPNSGGMSSITPFALMVLLFLLVNLGFITTSIIGDSTQAQPRNKELLVISNELLINPISLNN